MGEGGGSGQLSQVTGVLPWAPGVSRVRVSDSLEQAG